MYSVDSSLEKIDVVYTWCDGNDPLFQKERNETLKRIDAHYVEKAHGEARYFNNDELKYSLRSIEKYMPWVNHIYVVTNKQRPTWLANHPKISIIDHQEIIPNDLLPTFNSIMIEMYLHKIPGLSDKYIYFNDDVFVNEYLSPSFFFVKDKPVVRLTYEDKYPFLPSRDAGEDLLKNNKHFWFKTVIRAWLLAFKRYGRKEFYRPCHVADAYVKDMVIEAMRVFPELLMSNNSPFRSEYNIQRIIFNLVALYEFGSPCRVQKEPGIFYKLFGWRFKALEWYSRTESERTFKRILQFKPKMFSINTDETMDKSKLGATRKFLESQFPEKSSFEV